MKKFTLKMALLLLGTTAFAQVQVSTKSFDLESQNKHKGWSILNGGIDVATQKPYINFAQAFCDIDKSVGAYTVTTTFNGLKWTIDKTSFDKDFSFTGNTTKKYESCKEALLDGQQLFGQKFNTMMGDGVGAAFAALAQPTNKIDNSYMYTTIVMGTFNISGYKVASSLITTKVLGNGAGTGCIEAPAFFRQGVKDAKEVKGQRWIPMYNNPVPNGGNVLFNTQGVSANPDQNYFVLRKYDQSLEVVKEKAFAFDYQCILYSKEIEKAPGVFDYVFIGTPINYKKSKALVSPANQFEYIRVDGDTYEIKEQFKFTAPSSMWLIDQVTEDNGAVYISGPSADKSDVHKDFSLQDLSKYNSYQIVKIANGKMEYASNITQQQAQTAIKKVAEFEGKSDVHFNLLDTKIYIKNGKFIISGQQYIAPKREAMVTAIFDEKGQIEAYIPKPADVYFISRLSFNADNSKLFWLIEDITLYNDYDKKTGTISAKKAREKVNSLEILTYDLAAKNVAKYQSLQNEEWALNFKNPVLYDGPNDMILLGNTITKKAKESEVVFVSIKK